MDIKTWFGRAASKAAGSAGATEADFQRLQKALDVSIPSALKVLLAENGGTIYLTDKKLLSSDEIIDLATELDRNSNWKSGSIPLAGDASGAIVIDHKGNVREWEEDDGLGDELSSSFTAYLENYRNELLRGKYEFIAGVGAVETVAEVRSSRK